MRRGDKMRQYKKQHKNGLTEFGYMSESALQLNDAIDVT